MKVATITPAVLQIETHPYYQEAEMREYIKSYGTILEEQGSGGGLWWWKKQLETAGRFYTQKREWKLETNKF